MSSITVLSPITQKMLNGAKPQNILAPAKAQKLLTTSFNPDLALGKSAEFVKDSFIRNVHKHKAGSWFNLVLQPKNIEEAPEHAIKSLEEIVNYFNAIGHKKIAQKFDNALNVSKFHKRA